jgi:ribosomal-protein-alanine N-acetyltransferase
MDAKHVVLRSIVADDLKFVYEGLSHADVIKYYGISFNSIEGTKEQMEWFANQEEQNIGKWFAVVDKDSGEFYGAGGVNDINDGVGEIGFWLFPKYWGRGIMQVAMPKIVEFTFKNFSIDKIEGLVETDNLNCKKAMKKQAFIFDKTLLNCEEKNGKLISLDVYFIERNKRLR